MPEVVVVLTGLEGVAALSRDLATRHIDAQAYRMVGSAVKAPIVRLEEAS